MRLYSKTYSTIYKGYCGAVSHELDLEVSLSLSNQ